MNMRYWSILIAVVLALGNLARADEVLVWSDEFDGTSLDPSKWSYMYGDGSDYGIAGWGNNEQEYYTSRPENVYVEDGMLHIVAREESYEGFNYTSGRIRTLNKAEFLYGRIEGRMKIPSTKGIWPAFWMLPTNSPLGGWAASGEIDIMESVNIADTIYGTIHYGGQWPNNVHSGGERTNGIDYSQDFHVYGVEWTPQYLRWYVDGTPYYTRVASNWFSTAAPDDDNAPFDHPFHILLNVAVGGNFPGGTDGTSQFPQEIVVDWVRVYQGETTAPMQDPYNGIPQGIPGTLQMEDYDLGGQGVAYNDCDAANQGNAYRTGEGVDLEECSEGGFNVGWMCAGEWIEYTISVEATGAYHVNARVAAEQSNGVFRLALDGADVTPELVVPNTGGWQNWTTINSDASLNAGEHVLRFSNTGTAEFNINWISFEPNCVPGDINGDGVLDGDDIGGFAQALANPQSVDAFVHCAADVDQNGVLDTAADVSVFVSCLLASSCP